MAMERRKILLIPGLNLRPQALGPLAQALEEREFQTKILPLGPPSQWPSLLRAQDLNIHMAIGFSLGGLLLANAQLPPGLKVALLAPALFLRPISWAPYWLLRTRLVPSLPGLFKHYSDSPTTSRQAYMALYQQLAHFQQDSCSSWFFRDLFLAIHPRDEFIHSPSLKSWASPFHRYLEQDFKPRRGLVYHHFNFDPQNMGDQSFTQLVDALVSHADSGPWGLLEDWLQRAQRAQGPDLPFTLSTSSAQGEVSGRTVLFKGLHQKKFLFVGQHGSQKGLQLQDNPRAAITFYWPSLGLQLRAQGRAYPMEDALCDQFFAQRPWASQLASSLAHQSSPLEDPLAFFQKFHQASQGPSQDPIPRPSRWVVWGLSPQRIEFFSYGQHRLNYRKVYDQKSENGPWKTWWATP